ncbi:uncharacterized protein BX664DRAFT_116943 [Halteromyces radiatus]|uniref:uncharacterized protein n=1 Tax=Halteromyces radiatus TaxID=101107 RepID=UPI00221FCD22|nr:uncharacterized protein BX664DRAFT_116943 [Halteromyces radiatus]KAI8093919.1 hypothetical protein BX664DRAFT_116943 [Halteromyces radiatus]
MSSSFSYTQRIQQLAQQWKSKPKKIERLSKQELRQLSINEPTNLQVKLASSPYAAILASPIRYCTFHRKHFPSYLLMRFGIGLHPTTRKQWAYPTVQPDRRQDNIGKGHYVKLNHDVLEQVQRKEHKRLFRGQAEYAPGMTSHIESLMMECILQDMARTEYISIKQDTTLDAYDWNAYQCILVLSDQWFAKLNESTSLTCYDLSNPKWKPLHDMLRPLTKYDAVAIPKTLDTVSLAIQLFRFHQLINSSLSSTSSSPSIKMKRK